MPALALETRSRTEKLQLMETLWTDLARDAASLPSPAWHEQALEDAQKAYAEGRATFMDWPQAKRMLQGE